MGNYRLWRQRCAPLGSFTRENVMTESGSWQATMTGIRS
ncbi:hypothetical protein STRTUCAR8_06916 [Streptomyces turgidiscabies Car8]|uniref:Uncharacterized protein n=1 Tax=Streptomyces turgidiscabies (strain Car8) TaxID=698760 RepID=L7EXK1_STRT8|nr:hypothetical protein STRTUCAR8_06916 [Streptomyces turgidiscabies Car8]